MAIDSSPYENFHEFGSTFWDPSRIEGVLFRNSTVPLFQQTYCIIILCQVRQEVKFLEKFEAPEKFRKLKKEHISCSNLSHQVLFLKHFDNYCRVGKFSLTLCKHRLAL